MLTVVIPNTSGWRGGMYYITNSGEVYTTKYGRRMRLKPAIHSGYRRVCLWVNGKRKWLLVHRLVAKTFVVGESVDKPHVCHIDGNRLNNHFTNLRWGNYQDNADDRDLHGTTARGITSGPHLHPEKMRRGESHGMSKLKNADVIKLRSLRKAGESIPKLAKKFGIANTTVCHIIHRRIWRHL